MRRKFTVKEKLKQQPGIYKISCTETDKVYIGESVNISRRMQKHFSLLRHNKHSNPILQNIFNKYSEETFIVEVLEYTEFSDELELKILEQKYQKECPNCISLDSNEIFVIKRDEEWCKKQGEVLANYREQVLENWRIPIIVYDILEKRIIKFKQISDAFKLIEHKHLYQNIKDKIYVPYKNRYVAFLEKDFAKDSIKKIINPNIEDKTKYISIRNLCDLYNLITKEELHFASKKQFSLHFSNSKNDKLYDYYVENNLIDFDFNCVNLPKTKTDLFNMNIKLSRNKFCNVKIWYNALNQCTSKVDIAKATNIERRTIASYLKERSQIEWIKLLDSVISKLPD